MKIESVKSYTYTFYGAAIVDEDGALHTYSRVSVVSFKPLALAVDRMQDRIDSVLGDDAFKHAEPLMLSMLKGAEVTNIHKLVHPDGPSASVFVMINRDGHIIQHAYHSPLQILSKYDRSAAIEDWMPYPIAKVMVGDSLQLEHEPREVADLLNDASKRMDYIRDTDAAFDVVTPPETIARLKTEQEKLKQMAESMPDVVVGGPEDFNSARAVAEIMRVASGDTPATAVDGDNTQFVEAKVTGFSNVGMVAPGGHTRNADLLRIIHLSDPVWHEPDQEMQAEGFIGYWLFPEATIGQRVPIGSSTTHVVVEYTGYKDLKIAVRSFDAITPGGMTAMPIEVYRALAGKEPERTMTAKEAMKYTMEHSASLREIETSRN